MSHTTQPTALKMGIPIPNSKLGMWLFLGTEIMFFTAFIGSYIVLRIGSPGWPTDYNDTHINVIAGGINTFVLIVSSYCVVVAHEAMALRNFARARKFLWATLILAVVFLGIKSVELVAPELANIERRDPHHARFGGRGSGGGCRRTGQDAEHEPGERDDHGASSEGGW